MRLEGMMNFGETNIEQELLNQIEEKENQLPGFYTLLGKRYYELFHDNAQVELKDEVEAVSEQLLGIQKLKEQLQGIQEGRACPLCGEEINPNDRFCPACGKKLYRKEEDWNDSAQGRCPRCGHPVSDNQRFCVQCGYELGEEKEQLFDLNEDENHASVCPNCGASVEADMKFCIVCGQKLK